MMTGHHHGVVTVIMHLGVKPNMHRRNQLAVSGYVAQAGAGGFLAILYLHVAGFGGFQLRRPGMSVPCMDSGPE